MTGGSSRIRLARPRVYLFSLVLAFILFAETYCSQDDFDFKPFDFGAVPQNALALLKNSRTQFSANMPNVASIRDSMDKTAFSVDDLKSRFLIPVKDTPGKALFRTYDRVKSLKIFYLVSFSCFALFLYILIVFIETVLS